RTFAPIRTAIKVIGGGAIGGNPAEVDAVVQSMQIPELKGGAVKCIGALAGNGNETAMEILLNPRRYGLLQSGVVSALQPAADNGNQKAIDALAAVANDPKQTALCNITPKALEKRPGPENAAPMNPLIAIPDTTKRTRQHDTIPARP